MAGHRWSPKEHAPWRPLPTVDSLIAATALAHDLTIVTRNTKDFDGIGATTISPWEAA
jgi:predicted nucleic acid-binding protein